MKALPVALFAVAALVGARTLREVAKSERMETITDAPFAPSPAVAPLMSLGYRELAADLLYMKLRVYFGGYYETEADRVAAVGEAIIALDPRFEKVYDYAANAMTIAQLGVDQTTYKRAVSMLEQGITEFPKSWELPLLAGQIYIQDLKPDDPDSEEGKAQRRAWDERGTLLVESAIRKPRAPLRAATWAATLRTKMGQHERAVNGLRELLLTTNDKRARKTLLAALAKLEKADAGELASEIFEEKARFEREWEATRPALQPSMYILLGPTLPKRFDMTDLATGGHDFVGSKGIERLEPLYEDEPTSAGGPSSP
jgi:tetratricopeptide (TPR) repeat protein